MLCIVIGGSHTSSLRSAVLVSIAKFVHGFGTCSTSNGKSCKLHCRVCENLLIFACFCTNKSSLLCTKKGSSYNNPEFLKVDLNSNNPINALNVHVICVHDSAEQVERKASIKTKHPSN